MLSRVAWSVENPTLLAHSGLSPSTSEQQTMKNKPSRKRLRRRLALLLASTCLALLLAEGLLAAFPSMLPEPVRRHLEVSDGRNAKSMNLRAYEHDPVLEHRATAGFSGRESTSEFVFELRTVALPGLQPWGWRSEKFDPERSLDLIILGDSFAVGYGVEQEDTLAGRIIDYYRRRGKQAFNLGLSNTTGTLQYEIILQKALEHYSPKKVLLMHFENDYLDNAFFSIWKLARQSGDLAETRFPHSRGLWESVCPEQQATGSDTETPAPKRVFSGPRTFLYKHSAVWNILRYSLRLHPYSFARSGEFVGEGDISYVISPAFRAQATDLNRSCVRQGYQESLESLARIKAALDQRGIELCVLLIPFKESLLDPDDADVDRYHVCRNGVAALCHDMGAKVIDPLELWKPLSLQKQIYFPADGHWTSTGHQLAFDLVKQQFLSD